MDIGGLSGINTKTQQHASILQGCRLTWIKNNGICAESGCELYDSLQSKGGLGEWGSSFHERHSFSFSGLES